MKKQYTTTVSHHATDVVEIRPGALSPIRKFNLVGRLNRLGSHEVSHMDAFDIMDTLPTPARHLLREIKCHSHYVTNEATLPAPSTKSYQVARSKALKILKERDLVKKIGQRTFIINPKLILPPKEYQQTVLDKWNSL